LVRHRHREERMHKEKDYDSKDCVSEKKRGRTEWVSGADEQILDMQ